MKRIVLSVLQPLTNLLPNKLKWQLWLIFGVYKGFSHCLGVNVAIFNEKDEVLAVIKRFGISGVDEYTLSGGGKDMSLSPEVSAATELFQETGLSVEGLIPVNLFCVPGRPNAAMLYLGIKPSKVIFIQDATEIKWAGFVPIDKLRADHAEMATIALLKLQEQLIMAEIDEAEQVLAQARLY